MAKHSATKTDLYRKIEGEMEKLCALGILAFKNSKEKENMIGIAAATPEVFTPIVTERRGVQSFVAAGDISKSRDGKQIFPIADIDAIMNNCRVDWEQRIFMPREDGSLEDVGTLREHFKSLIPLGLTECKDEPFIPEKWFEGKLPRDTNSAGQDSIRDPSRLDFSLHRTMIISHEKNTLLLKEHREKIKKRAQETQLKRIAKYNEYFSDNDTCENHIRTLAKIDNDQPIVNVEIAVFRNRSILKPLLVAFIKLRDNKDITAPTDHFPIKKGGLIKMAFEMQSHPVIADRGTIPTLDVSDPVTENVGEFQLSVSATWSVTDHFIRKSCVLIATLGDGVVENAVAKIEDLRDNTLAKILMLRYGVLLQHHPIRRNHFTVKFIENNVRRAAVILKMHELYPDDKELKNFRSSKDSLFKIDMSCGNHFVHEEPNSNDTRFKGIGAYIMADSKRGNTIRAGSTTTSFVQRLKEHWKCSKLKKKTDRDSRLYGSYPHEDAAEVDKQRSIFKPKGVWQSIHSYVVVGWDKVKSKELIDLFEWDTETMAGLRPNLNDMEMEKKQERMLVYLFELLLQLSLDPSHNISSNPGFETFNGTFAST
jgi:hypothetical protein